jgi:hypothetical protein
MVVALNANKEPAIVGLPLPEGFADGVSFGAAWGEGDYTTSQGTLANVRIPAREGVVLYGEVSSE